MTGNSPAEQEIHRLLEKDGAKLEAEKNHYKWRLSNGNVFVVAKTPSDWRSSQNNLSNLRRQLGITRQQAGGTPQPVEPPMPFPPPPPPPEASKAPLAERIGRLIAEQEALNEFHLKETYRIDLEIKMLKEILPFIEGDKKIETAGSILERLFPPTIQQTSRIETPEGEKPVTDRIQVTRELVYLASQTFDKPFTLNELLERMIGEKQVNDDERRRIRSSIASLLYIMLAVGKIERVQEGRGKIQALWAKVTHGKNHNEQSQAFRGSED